jgi:hypothetical protein
VVGLVDLASGAAIAVTKSFALGAIPTLSGLAKVADQRPLAGATVIAIPTHCFEPNSIADARGLATPPAPSPWCMPRPAQTTTASDGSFSLAIDPGAYALSVRPSDGTRLPWVTQPISVSLAPAGFQGKVQFMVPAPFSVGLQLVDPYGNRLVHAIVRAFAEPPAVTSVSGTNPAVELGEAITDENGNYEMYVTLPSQ